METKTCDYGGHGVAIGLQHSQNTPKVVWVEGNSYVIVEDDERGDWFHKGSVPVRLLSINGIGEVRWAVSSWHPRREEKVAADYFGLVPNRPDLG